MCHPSLLARHYRNSPSYRSDALLTVVHSNGLVAGRPVVQRALGRKDLAPAVQRDRDGFWDVTLPRT